MAIGDEMGRERMHFIWFHSDEARMRFHLVIDATCVDGVSRRAYQTQVCGEMHHAMALVYVCEY